jgi:hypothetical protein
MGEGFCTRQHHAKQGIILDAGWQTVHAGVAANDENIVGLQSFRPMQGQKLKVEGVGEILLPIQEGARTKMIEPRKDPYRNRPVPAKQIRPSRNIAGLW